MARPGGGRRRASRVRHSTDQHDWPTAVRLAEILDLGAVEVHRATAARGRPIVSGRLAQILMAQPTAGSRRTCSAAYPDRRHMRRVRLLPYDMAG
jgi:hypothetical protein